MADGAQIEQPAMEAIKPRPPIFRSPKRIDWATSQTASEDTTVDDTAAHNDVFTTPPSKQIRSGTPTPKILPAIINGVEASAKPRVYDIPTLLQLSGSLVGIGFFGKIKPEALAGKVYAMFF